MVVQKLQETLDNANSYHTCEPGMCLKYTRTWHEIASSCPDAQAAWDTAIGKHPGDKSPPDGAPVFWKSGPGGSGHGHICTTMKNVPMRTTDKPQSGKVDNDDGSWPHDHWGQSYLGWAEGYNGTRIPYLKSGGDGGDDWRASGDVYVEKLHRGQQDSDSVSRLRYRLQNHSKMPDNKKPGYGAGYGPDTQEAVKYCVNHILAPENKGPRDGSSMSNDQANRLFGDNYRVIEE